MHYYIDGYNLLFRSAWKIADANLEKMRSQLIQELDNEVSVLHINVTIVFDAPLQNEELRKGHFRSLEIIFTSRGETADDFLISTFQTLDTPKNALLVSSDRDLQKRAKLFSVRSQSVEEFLSWLRKRSFKKRIVSEKPIIKSPPKQVISQKPTSQPSKKKKKDSQEIETEKQTPSKLKKKLHTPTKNELPPLSDFHEWEELFKARLAALNDDIYS